MAVLSGIRIVEFDALGPVPFCGMLLADHGADIVRIVRPGSPIVDDAVGGAILHRGRTSVELDLKKTADRQAALRLITQADALLEGFRPKVMERLELGPEPCLAANPRLVYGRMTGWGQTGPLALRAGHDINYIALTGALHAIGPTATPVPPLNLVADYGGGAKFLAFGVLAALLDAKTSGRGRVVDAAMCDAVPLLLSLFHAFATKGKWLDERESNLLDGGTPFYRCYPCLDGKFVAVGALEPQFYREMLNGLGLDPLAFPQDDRERWPAAIASIGAVFVTRTRDEWAEHFSDSDACVSPVLNLSESTSASHLKSRGVFTRHGATSVPAPAPRFDKAQAPGRSPWRDEIEIAIARWNT